MSNLLNGRGIFQAYMVFAIALLFATPTQVFAEAYEASYQLAFDTGDPQVVVLVIDTMSQEKVVAQEKVVSQEAISSLYLSQEQQVISSSHDALAPTVISDVNISHNQQDIYRGRAAPDIQVSHPYIGYYQLE